MMKYEGIAGETIDESARNAIAMALRFNCEVQLLFNGEAVVVNKMMGVQHVVEAWRRKIDASVLRYRTSPAGVAAKLRRESEVAAAQASLDSLMKSLPTTKDGFAAWLAAWIPVSDRIGVNRRSNEVIAALRGVGFTSGQHVGAKEFSDGTASKTMMIEYIAGQVISMLDSVGCVHPMLGEWAAKAAEEIQC